MSAKPTDEEIYAVLAKRGASMTYVLRNWLCDKYRTVGTPFVLRRLKAMERAGRVKRVPTSYIVQIRWEVAGPAPKQEGSSE